MDFLRRNMFYLICGVVAAGAGALGFTGLSGMPEVRKELSIVAGIYENLDRVKSVNQDRLDAEQERIDTLMEDRNTVFARAEKTYGYEPLIKDVFPSGDTRLRLAFREAYGPAMDALLRTLNYGGTATAQDISIWRDRIADEVAQQKDRGLDAGVATTQVAPTGPARTAAGVLTQAGARTDPTPRAHMAAAQRAYCYAIHFNDPRKSKISSLDVDEHLLNLGNLDAPFLADLWQAQLGYWIQKDVIEAIVAVNSEAADQARKEGRNAWIGIMPVKELVSIRLFQGYVSPDSGSDSPLEANGSNETYPTGSSDFVFTQSASADWFEVVQFSVKLVMDQRDILRFVDQLCKESLHTLDRIAYEAVRINRTMVGKIYGSEPTVTVVMDFETIMLGEIFRPLMPTAYCDEFDIICPERPEEE